MANFGRHPLFLEHYPTTGAQSGTSITLHVRHGDISAENPIDSHDELVLFCSVMLLHTSNTSAQMLQTASSWLVKAIANRDQGPPRQYITSKYIFPLGHNRQTCILDGFGQ
ncbi:predicted protein [Histoplasma capsulatum G186AR]|uniref:Uncharacterized protein n=1 Tax=Ajellomyces capsulatus (strain G186AR / H82 / ATCC MYA-2454 / RMSCC 2432) TaxID=447093 RepID=C0NNZ9_AJECG|nr:uncharacterized protein HCBG_04879 [Histoplasma capsulatum G186AR]EEH06659.1 predicted protein [Histoplasma capsulatum G186AR]